LKKHSILSILLLWLVRPTRGNTPKDALDLFEAAIFDEQLGKKQDAIKKYTRAIDIFPEFEAAWLNLAMAHQDLGEAFQSIATAEKALEKLPDSTVIWGALGTFYSRSVSRIDEAENAYRKAIECNPTNSLAMSNLGLHLANLGRLDEAEKILSKSREVNPEGIGESKEWDAHVRRSLSRIRTQLKMSDGDEKLENDSVVDVQGLLRMAELSMRNNDFVRAEDLLRKATTPSSRQAIAEFWFRLGHYYFKMGRGSDEKRAFRTALELDEHLTKARNDLADSLNREGKYQEAESLLQPAIIDDPDDHYVWMNLGKALFGQQKFNEAEKMFEKVVELESGYVNAHFQLGKIFQMKEDLKRAEAAFRKTVELQPSSFEGWTELGLVFMKMNQAEDAEKAWKTATTYNPNYDAPWVNLSSLYSMSGRCDEARDALSRAQRLAPHDQFVIRAEMLWKTMCGGGANPEISKEFVDTESENLEYTKLINRGAVMLDNGQLQDAEQCYRRAVELDASDPLGWGMLGTVLRAIGQLDEADKAFKKALKSEKEIPPSIYANYTVLLKQVGRTDEAEKVLLRLTKEHPDFTIGWFNLGNLYLTVKDWKRAKDMYLKALETNPQPNAVVNIKWNLGVAFKELQEYTKAEKVLLEALQLDPTNQSIQTVLRQVRESR